MTLLNYRSGIEEASVRARNSPPHNWLAWAVYLGVSWTWCIGMFLPVLLVRDLGGWGWVTFAIPNVVGAAAMGWIVRAETSVSILLHHRRTIEAFGCVSAAFQLYFAFWVFGGAALALVALAVMGAIACLARPRAPIALSAIAIVLSAYSVFLAVKGHHITSPSPAPENGSAIPVASLLSLFPVCCFGFLLCPYLDPTFHLAARHSSEPKASFGLGFGVLFLLMIVFSLGYAATVIMNWGPLHHPSLTWLSWHWAAQLVVTTSFQWAAIQALDETGGRFGVSGKSALVGAVSAMLLWVGADDRVYHGLGGGELIYRLFMAFYGLVFPAYVWLCMIPGRGRVSPDRRQWIVLAVTILVAAPMYWMGFIERRMFWLLPGLSVVLLARLLIPRKYPQPSSVSQLAESTNAAAL